MAIREITEGEFAGWQTWPDDPFESGAGPFFFRRDKSAIVAAFRAEPRHMNGGGFMHGGCLMTFADFALFALAEEELKGDHAVTVSFASEFLAGATTGQLITCRGDVLRAGRSMVFVRGLIAADETPCLNFSGTIKRIRAQS